MSLEEIYSENAVNIYKKLYLARNNNNEVIETIDECHDRVANFLAENGDEYNNFRRLLDEQKFRPNTPCMANAGIKKDPMMLACFVLDLQDTMDSIINMWGTCAKIYEGGGGAGIPITNLRKKGAGLSKGGYASGPLSYLNVIEVISEEIKSGGKQRRAANLIAAKYNHPDIMNIINCKRDKKSYKSMNLSIVVDDKFMELAKIVTKTRNTHEEIELIDPNEGPTGKTISVMDLWKHICQAAWETGDPGLLFIDRVNRDNPLDILIESTNPCGEASLWPNSCCNLGHLNVIKYDGPDDSAFENDIYWSTLFLNRIIDKSSYPNKKFEENMKKYRPIGLGLMGFADYLYKEKIQYGSQKSCDVLHNFTKALTKYAFKSSSLLVSNALIPDMTSKLNTWEKTRFNELVNRFADIPAGKELPGNITVTTIAPTGSTALSADCSYSTEPQFGLIWTKILDNGETMEFLNPEFEKALNSVLRCGKYARDKDEVIREIKRNKGTLKNTYFPEEYQWIRDVFVTAHDIPNEQRIEVQAAAQKNITMAVSSTVNLPKSASTEDVAKIYLMAWEKDLKGITVYRDGSLDDQPIDFGTETESQQAHTEAEQHDPSTKESSVTLSSDETQIKEEPLSLTLESFEYTQPLDRPDNLSGTTKKILTGSGELYLTVNWHNGRPFEVFATIGKGGRSMAAKAEAIGRLVSLALRCGVHIDHIIKQLEGIGGDYPIFQNGGLIKSIPDAIASVLREIRNQVDEVQELSNEWDTKPYNSNEWSTKNPNEWECGLEVCPECGQPALRRDAGCRGGICTICGFSNCQ
jgi:ribonucleoside-diphosphate reductase alpha chain